MTDKYGESEVMGTYNGYYQGSGTFHVDQRRKMFRALEDYKLLIEEQVLPPPPPPVEPPPAVVQDTPPGDWKETFHSQLDTNGAWHGVLAPDWVMLCELFAEGMPPVPITPKPQPPRTPDMPAPPEEEEVDPNPEDPLPNHTLPHTVFMCDRSGSMGQEMPNLRKSIMQCIESYTAKDRPFAVMAWSNSAEWPKGNPCWVTAADKSEVSLWAEKLQAEGGTQPSNALQSVVDSPLGKQVRHIMILCDGAFSDLSESTLGELMKQMPECKSISWVGFGPNADRQKMKSLTKGLGKYYQFKASEVTLD